MAEGVYVGTGVLAADDDARRSRAWAGLLGVVLVLVMAVEQVRVTGLFVSGVDRHVGGARLFQVEDASIGYRHKVPFRSLSASRLVASNATRQRADAAPETSNAARVFLEATERTRGDVLTTGLRISGPESLWEACRTGEWDSPTPGVCGEYVR